MIRWSSLVWEILEQNWAWKSLKNFFGEHETNEWGQWMMNEQFLDESHSKGWLLHPKKQFLLVLLSSQEGTELIHLKVSSKNTNLTLIREAFSYEKNSGQGFFRPTRWSWRNVERTNEKKFEATPKNFCFFDLKKEPRRIDSRRNGFSPQTEKLWLSQCS